jgi:hypothetical protein
VLPKKILSQQLIIYCVSSVALSAESIAPQRSFIMLASAFFGQPLMTHPLMGLLPIQDYDSRPVFGLKVTCEPRQNQKDSGQWRFPSSSIGLTLISPISTLLLERSF